MENIAITNHSLYQDLDFWTTTLSGIAIILSQIPPIRLWFKKAKIDFELHSKLAIMHKAGNP